MARTVNWNERARADDLDHPAQILTGRMTAHVHVGIDDAGGDRDAATEERRFEPRDLDLVSGDGSAREDDVVDRIETGGCSPRDNRPSAALGSA